MTISVRNVSKRFGQHQAVDDVSLEIPNGRLVALLGPSGSGKTTLLRIIAGLEMPDSGTVYLHDEEALNRHVRKRHIGFVFQHYALFRHMTVYDNIAFPMKMRKRPKAEIRERVTELLNLIQLENTEHRYPAQLSGGQRQRIALARALASRPRVLLLDEPFGALDAQVRQELRKWLRQLHDQIHLTSVFVTHDQEEALELADEIVVMNKGRIEQSGPPEEVYHSPANPFVMRFLGQVNLFHARSEGDQYVVGASNPLDGAGERIVAYARPHELDVSRTDSDGRSLAARVERINAAGHSARLDLKLCDEEREIVVLLSQERFNDLRPQVGETVFVKPKEVKVFVSDYVI